ncbi:MAG: amino acid permease [Bryobacterales bacterium]|nr:amino acid permease [Bryobacterales bacterium]
MANLVRGLTLTSAASLNIANMIGTGVFLKARVMTCNVESPILVLAVWALAGLMVLAGALCYAELAAMLPRAGGEYVFLREAYGSRAGFLWGWSFSAITRPASIAAQSVATAIFLNIVLGGAIKDHLVLASITGITLATLLNSYSVKATGSLATFFTVVKIVVVASVGICAFVFSSGNWLHYALSGAAGACEAVPSATRGGIAGVAAAMTAALWGFQGWALFTPLAGEVSDPQRNIPRAYVLALVTVAALYLFANASYFYSMTPADVASVPLSSSVATEMLTRLFGATAAALMSAGMLVSSFGALQTGIAPAMRVPYAMAADGLYFQFLNRLSSRGVPVRAGVFAAVLASLLALSGNYDRLTDYAVFSLWLFYGLTASSLLVLRSKMPNAPRPYRVLAYPFLPLLFCAVTLALLLNTLYTQPLQSFAGLAIIAAGLPFHAYWTRKQTIAAANPVVLLNEKRPVPQDQP